MLKTFYKISLWIFCFIFWITLMEFIDRINRVSMDEKQLWFIWSLGSAIAVVLMLFYRRKIITGESKKEGIYKIVFFYFVMFTVVEIVYLYQKFSGDYGSYSSKIRIVNSIFFLGLCIITGFFSYSAGIWRRKINS